MAISTLYEPNEVHRSGPKYVAGLTAKAVENAAERKIKVICDAESVAIEKRERAMHRQYLPEWICNLLDG